MQTTAETLHAVLIKVPTHGLLLKKSYTILRFWELSWPWISLTFHISLQLGVSR